MYEYQFSTLSRDGNQVPEFTEGDSATRTVDENTPSSQDIGAPVTATDADNDTLTYSLGGADAGLFSVDSGTGQITVGVGATLDYETLSTYSVTVSVSDRKDADGNADTATDDTITVAISVTNVDEPGAVALPAQPQAGAPLTTTLTDPDGGRGSVTWRWESSDSATGTFTAIGGATSVTYTPVAGDVGYYLRVTASYTDGEGAGKSAQAVSANPVEDAPPPPPPRNQVPEFTEGDSATRTVDENTPSSQDIGAPVTATDADNDTLTYSLGGADAGLFSVDSGTGQITVGVGATLDYETLSTYSVTVSVSDRKDADGNADTATDDTITVAISVTNVDEPGAVALPAQPQAGAPLTTTLTDPDGGRGSVTWRWESSDSATGTFTAIGGATSATYTPVAGDVGYYLRVTASYTDGEGAGKSAQAVSANPVEDAPPPPPPRNQVPEFTEGDSATRTVDENTPSSQDIGAPVTATDADNDTLTYSLGGADAGLFSVDSGTGQITVGVGATLDYETLSTYSVTVSVSDRKDADGNADTATDDTITVAISVTNVDEPGAVALPAQPQAGAPLTTTLTDPDGGRGSVTWRWESSDSATGTFTAIGGATSATYTPVAGDVGYYLRVTASYTDGEGAGKSAQAVSANPVRAATTTTPTDATLSALALSGVTLNPPFANGIYVYTASVANSVPSTSVTATASHAQASYVVKLNGTVDPDGMVELAVGSNNVIAIEATAQDGATKQTYSVTVTRRTVPPPPPPPRTNGGGGGGGGGAPANRAPEFMEGDRTARLVAENTPAGANIGEPVVASDFNRDALTYSLRGVGSDLFDLDASSGQLLTKAALDYETEASYIVFVWVQDNKDANGRADTQRDTVIRVALTVTNEDEAGTVALSLSEPDVGVALTAALTDPDGGLARVVWSWERSANQTAWTAVRGAASASYTPVAADKGSYLRATASYTDGHGPRKSAQAATATPVPSNAAPVFPGVQNGAIQRSVAENTGEGEVVGDPVAATDAEDDALTCALGGPDADLFTIDEQTGQIRVGAGTALDYEADKNVYEVTVTATDSSGARATVTVTIAVTDVGLGSPSGDAYDADGNEAIGRDEAVAAVVGYFSGAITQEEAIEIIQLYFSG